MRPSGILFQYVTSEDNFYTVDRRLTRIVSSILLLYSSLMKLSLSPFLSCLSRWKSAVVSCWFQLILADFWPLFSLRSFGNSECKVAFRSELFMSFIFRRSGWVRWPESISLPCSFEFRILESIVRYYVKYNISNIDHKYNIPFWAICTDILQKCWWKVLIDVSKMDIQYGEMMMHQ